MYRLQNRLSLEVYKQYQAYYLTLNCFNRIPYFQEEETVNQCIIVLKDLKKQFRILIWAYCFMPDHIHLLLETNNCLDIMKLFKQKTGFHFKKSTDQTLWQKSFYDHIVRQEESLPDIAAYIFNNPVRAGLVSNYSNYPNSGSLEFDLHDFMET